MGLNYRGGAYGPRASGDEPGGAPGAPYMRFVPPARPPPRIQPAELAWRGLRSGGFSLAAAAVVAHLLGLYYLYDLTYFGTDAWFYDWAGPYELIAGAAGVYAAACAFHRTRPVVILLGMGMLVVGGMLDFGIDGTIWAGMILIGLTVVGGLLYALPSIDRSVRDGYPRGAVARMTTSPYGGTGSASVEGLMQAQGVELSRRWTGGTWRLGGAVVLVLASVLIIPSGVMYMELALWYHASEGFLEVDGTALGLGLFELASAVVGLVAAYRTLRGPRPLLGTIASGMLASNAVVLIIPPYWHGFTLGPPPAPIACFALGAFSLMVQMQMAREIARLGPPTVGGAPATAPSSPGLSATMVAMATRAGRVPWLRVTMLAVIMLVLGPSLGLVLTHEHIVGEVTEVGEDRETSWEYFIVETDYDSYIVYNRFPNSPTYRYSVGDHFDEWVPDACWFRF